MNRIVILVSNGVADYSSDDTVNVLIIDIDNLKAGDNLSQSDISGFEDLIPDYVLNNYICE